MQAAAPPFIDSRFVGRARELDPLSLGLDQALAARGRLFLIVDEPRIGKTAHCDAATSAAAGEGREPIR